MDVRARAADRGEVGVSALDAEAQLLHRCKQLLLQKLVSLEEEEKVLRAALPPPPDPPRRPGRAASLTSLQPTPYDTAPLIWRRAGERMRHSGLTSDSGLEDDEDEVPLSGSNGQNDRRAGMRVTTGSRDSPLHVYEEDSGEDEDDEDGAGFLEAGTDERLRLLAAAERARHLHLQSQPQLPLPPSEAAPPPPEAPPARLPQQVPQLVNLPQMLQPQMLMLPQQQATLHVPPTQADALRAQQRRALLESLGGESSPWLAETAPAWARRRAGNANGLQE